MNTVWILTSLGFVSYLLGSIPFGYLIARARGIDIRRVGSGNIGATNVLRCVGRGWGLLTFFCDFAKGFVAAFLIPLLLSGDMSGEQVEVAKVVCGCLAVAGHNWPVTLRFRGGKGIATSAGALLGFAPLAVGIGVAAWLVVFLATRYVSVASMAAAIAMGAGSWIAYRGRGLLIPVTLTVLALVAIWRHKGNIRRLADGTENRVTFRKEEESE